MVESLGFSSPLPLELRQTLTIVCHFAEVIPSEAVLAGIPNRFQLNDVVGMKAKVLVRATCECIGNGLAETQQNGTCNNPL